MGGICLGVCLGVCFGVCCRGVNSLGPGEDGAGTGAVSRAGDGSLGNWIEKDPVETVLLRIQN